MTVLQAFTPRRVEDIVASALGYVVGHTTQVTDLTPGSVLRTMIEAVGIELEHLNTSTLTSLAQAIEESGYRAFNFRPLDPIAASGAVLFTRKMLASPVLGTAQAIPGSAGVSFGAPGYAVAGSYYYQVTATNAQGETIGALPTLVVVGAGQLVSLAWGMVPGATGYRVYRATTSAMTGATCIVIAGTSSVTLVDAGALLGAATVPGVNTTGALSLVTWSGTPFTGASSTGGNLAQTTTYRYVLTALNAQGETTVSAEQSYAVPTSGTATNQVTLNWNAVTGATGYKVYRTLGGGGAGSEQLLATLGAVTTYADVSSTTPSGAPPVTNTAYLLSAPGSLALASATAGTGTGFGAPGYVPAATYWYQVVATNASGTTQGSTVLAAVAAAGQQLTVSWGAVSGATGYRVYRSSSSTMGGALAFPSQTVPSVVDAGAIDLAATPPVTATAQAVAGPFTVTGGTRVGVKGTSKVYSVPAAVTFSATDNSKLVTVVATTPGSLGNTTANTITQVLTANANIGSVTNPAALTTGADLENGDDTRHRFAAYVQGLARSTNGALATGARTAQLSDQNGVVIERVVQALAIDNGGGNVLLYIYNGNPLIAESGALQTQCANVINGYTDASGVTYVGYKAAGVVVTVTPATRSSTNVGITVRVAPNMLASGVDPLVRVRAGVVQAVVDYFSRLSIGDGTTVSFDRAALIKLLLRVPGVTGVDVTTPAATTLIPPAGTILTLGTTTLVKG